MCVCVLLYKVLESCCCFVVESGKIFSGEEQGSLQVALKDGNSIHLVEIEPQHQPMHHVGWMCHVVMKTLYSCLIANHSDWLALY